MLILPTGKADSQKDNFLLDLTLWAVKKNNLLASELIPVFSGKKFP